MMKSFLCFLIWCNEVMVLLQLYVYIHPFSVLCSLDIHYV